jgi:hypothetical protein
MQYESKYPHQIPLPVENVLPPIKSNIKGYEITQRKIKIEQMATRTVAMDRLNYFWTNDQNIMATTDVKPKTSCNSFASPDEPNLTYNCVIEKMCYFIHYLHVASSSFLSIFKLDILTPAYSSTPYEFIHRGMFFGRSMNLFNMVLSTKLVELLETKNIEWITRILMQIEERHGFNRNGYFIAPLSFEIQPPYSMARNYLGQLISPVLLTDIKGYDPANDDFKLQICAKEEYIYWIVETILLHFNELVRLGLKRFKYSFLVGEHKLFSINEYFPDLHVDRPIEHHVHKGIQFKTELLISPNIVLYTRNQDNYTELIHMLCGLFPDTFPLSKGISRFNMRLNDNLTYSVGGHNQFKFEKLCDILPIEYKLVVNAVKQHPERYAELSSYSKIVTGHTLLNANGTINKILSYNSVPLPYTSFQEIYAKYGLMDYYIPLPPDLNSQIMTLPRTKTDIIMYANVIYTDVKEPSVEMSKLPSGGKTNKKRRKTYKNKHKKPRKTIKSTIPLI